MTLKAVLSDQYLNERGITPQYFLASDLTGKQPSGYDGESLEGGKLTLSANSSLENGDVIVVAAKAGSKQAAAFIKLSG